jgi:ASC-1-like (ASCH) protein/ribosomal protein S18 acetylase RimI-like enzyme
MGAIIIVSEATLTLSTNEKLFLRGAIDSDRTFIIELMDKALAPYYGGDHRAHAERIFSTHISGGTDRIGYFSFEQRMFVALVDGVRAGIVHIVGKRQGTYKISPIIVAPEFRGRGIGPIMLRFVEDYAKERKARQIYCTVAKENKASLHFFLRHGYMIAGMSDSHYKVGITEAMLYRQFYSDQEYEAFDRLNISVRRCGKEHEEAVRRLLLHYLPTDFYGIDDQWVDALFEGYSRKETKDVNLKYKLIFVAVDRDDKVLGVAGATPKKGEPIKIMPFIATSLPAFVALLGDVPYQLRPHGRKLYVHIMPTVEEAQALQQRGWHLDAALPGAYHQGKVMQQWSLDLLGEDVMRVMRVKQRFLDLIRSGKKTLEVRVGYSSIRTVQPGEHIRLMSRDQSEVIKIKDVRVYETFDDMLAKEDATKIVPDLPSEDVLPLLKQIYPADRENLGVYVLEIELDRMRVEEF